MPRTNRLCVVCLWVEWSCAFLSRRESARRLWRVRLCPCSSFSLYVHCTRRWSAFCTVLHSTHQTEKSVRFLPLTAAALERVVATGDYMLPAGAATGRFCALQSEICGSVARAQSVCAQSATAKRPPGAQQWSLQQRAKSSLLQFMQELAESSTTLLQPPLRGRFSQFEFACHGADACRVCRFSFCRCGQLQPCSQQR